jgi:hypothetical protein
MASFAKIGLNGKVIAVHSVVNEVLHDSNGIEKEDIGIDFLTKLHGWSMYGLKLLIILMVEFTQNGGIPLRKNYAGIGYTYDEDRDAFIPKKPYSVSWILNEHYLSLGSTSS